MIRSRPNGTWKSVRGAGHAFTLVEIMLAIGIFSGVVLAIYASWNAILRSSRIGLQAAAEAQRNRLAVQALGDALDSLQFFTANPGAYPFIADTTEEDATLSFVARLPRSYPRSGRYGDQLMRQVIFSVEADGSGNKRLMLRQRPFLSMPDQDEEENPLVLAENLKLFHLEFMAQGGSEWQPEWIFTNRLPRLIRFSLALGQPGKEGVRQEDVVSRVVTLATAGTPPGMRGPNVQRRPVPNAPGLENGGAPPPTTGGPRGPSPRQPAPSR